MATRKKKAKWLVKLLKVIVVVYLLLILYQLIGNVYSRLSNTHEIQVPEEWNLIVVNRWNELPEDYDVELTELSNGQMVDSRIYPYLQEMFDAARTEDVYPVVREGYRTAEEQQEILDDKIQSYINQGYSQVKAERTAKEWVGLLGGSYMAERFRSELEAVPVLQMESKRNQCVFSNQPDISCSQYGIRNFTWND